MKKKKNTNKAKESIREIAALLGAMNETLFLLAPMVYHAKETTDDFNAQPTTSNRVVMKMARGNVVKGAERIGNRLYNFYDKLLSKESKKIFSFEDFCEEVQTRLVAILINNTNEVN